MTSLTKISIFSNLCSRRLVLPLPALLGGIASLTLLLYASGSVVKPPASWRWLDVLAEGGTALMAGTWTWLVLTCRPPGRVTWLLAGGLSLLMLGAWLDCLDEFFVLSAAASWAKAVESACTLGGMLVLTAGLWSWRHEQFSLTELLHKRERLFREHRGFDRITQLADAGYLRQQLHLERRRCPQAACALLMLELDHFHRLRREQGVAEADRLLQAVAHLLLLNLRNDDLLCRYAGDRFVVLLPETSAAQARTLGRQLQQAVASLAHYPRRQSTPLPITARVVSASADAVGGDDAEALLRRLNGEIARAADLPA